VAKQAVKQTYTYYTPDEPTGRVVKDAELDGRGKAWTLGEYHHPDYPSPLNVRVGEAGIKVWMAIFWLRLCEGDYDELVRRYGSVLNRDDIAAARWFYTRYKQEVDQRIDEEEQYS
jgi:hypothetical protein